MLPNGFTTAALVASLLLGTSALALAQTRENPAAGPAATPAPIMPGATQAEPEKTPAEPKKATQAEPQKPQTEPQRATQAEPQKPQTEPQKATQAEPQKPQTEPQRATQAEPQKPQTEPQRATQAEPQKAAPQQGDATKPSPAASRGNSPAATPVNLTTTQKTEIHNTIINNSSAPRATNININLAVGVMVPPAVQFAPLPANVIAIEPAWRGYEYFLYGEQIVIIEPDTRQIIAIVIV